MRIRKVMVAATLSALAACSAETGGDDGDTDAQPPDPCLFDRCDLPDDPAARSCELRRKDAFNENQQAFTETALRWSCADVDGVTGDDRGQEYCEYFAVVKLPPTATEPEPEAQVLGRLNRYEPEDPDAEDAEITYDTTPVTLELSDEAITELEGDLDAIVGQCVFTSWNSDIPGPVPACETVAQSECPEVLGLPIDEQNFRMKFDVNSAEAAQFLVEDCMCAYSQFEECLAPDVFEGDPNDPEDRLHDDFFRGCMLNADVNQTEFRKSDTTVCAASIRLAECGCSVDVSENPELDLPRAISPPERRGFVLGTWSGISELPVGCQFVDIGDGSQTLVTCDLSASEVLAQSADLKQLCREKYGPNVVVHVPIPPEAIECDPSATGSLYADTCSDTPWVVTEQRSYPAP